MEKKYQNQNKVTFTGLNYVQWAKTPKNSNNLLLTPQFYLFLFFYLNPGKHTDHQYYAWSTGVGQHSDFLGYQIPANIQFRREEWAKIKQRL